MGKGKQTEQLEDLIKNMMFMREVLKDRLRVMKEKLPQVNGEEAEHLDEYASRLHEIIIDMGNLMDRIATDISTDDPEFASEVATYLGGQHNVHF